MGTKTASKHGLRATAEAKASKHAQRTPLPPRKADAELIAEMAKELQAEQAAKKSKKAKEPKTREEVSAAFDAKQFEGKSGEKALAFITEIAAHGWKKQSTVKSDDHIEVVVTRGVEAIFIEWTGGVFQPTATWTYGERTVKLRNASAARQYASRAPEVGAAETERVATNKAFKKRDPEASSIRPAKLPFDLATATEGEMLKALLGRTITWHNRISNATETASVLANPRQVRFSTYAGEIVMSFLCPNTGYRACRLAAITRLSKGASEYVSRADREEARSPRGRAVKA